MAGVLPQLLLREFIALPLVARFRGPFHSGYGKEGKGRSVTGKEESRVWKGMEVWTHWTPNFIVWSHL